VGVIWTRTQANEPGEHAAPPARRERGALFVVAVACLPAPATPRLSVVEPSLIDMGSVGASSKRGDPWLA